MTTVDFLFDPIDSSADTANQLNNSPILLNLGNNNSRSTFDRSVGDVTRVGLSLADECAADWVDEINTEDALIEQCIQQQPHQQQQHQRQQQQSWMSPINHVCDEYVDTISFEFQPQYDNDSHAPHINPFATQTDLHINPFATQTTTYSSTATVAVVATTASGAPAVAAAVTATAAAAAASAADLLVIADSPRCCSRDQRMSLSACEPASAYESVSVSASESVSVSAYESVSGYETVSSDMDELTNIDEVESILDSLHETTSLDDSLGRITSSFEQGTCDILLLLLSPLFTTVF